MYTTLTLMLLLNNEYKPPEGMSHKITIEGGRLKLSVISRGRWYHFFLYKEEMDQDAGSLFDAIKKLMPKLPEKKPEVLDLEAVMKLLDSPSGLIAEPGDYAEYLDESNPDAGVAIKSKDGTPRMIIPIDVWDHIKDEKQNELHT